MAKTSVCGEENSRVRLLGGGVLLALVACAAIIAACVMMPARALAEESAQLTGDFVLSSADGSGSAPKSPDDYEIVHLSDGHYILKLKSDYPFAIRMVSGVPTEKGSIVIADGGPSKVVFNNVKIQLSDGDAQTLQRSALLYAKSNSDAVFEFNGECEMKGSGSSAGIQKDSAASTLSLEGGAGSTLKATGGSLGGAGIGGAAGSNGSDITIKNFVKDSPSVTAQGGSGAAGIGGGSGGDGTNIIIEDSTVDATGAGGGAGIGGGARTNEKGGTGDRISITFNNSGAKVTATGSAGGAGIGGGSGGEGRTIAIKESDVPGDKGGKVTAKGSEGGAGIGGGASKKGDGIVIDADRLNSVITATGGVATDKVGGGAGIGGGGGAEGKSIVIKNARWVGATGGAEKVGVGGNAIKGGGAGIGGGADGHGSDIEISRSNQSKEKSEVVATGGPVLMGDPKEPVDISTKSGAGIGGGSGGNGSDITVNNVALTATGAGGGAGIGGGFEGEGSAITLEGEGGGSATGNGGGAGVGGGKGRIGKSITISGTPITDAIGGKDGGAGIGGGAGAPAETITFADLSKDINATALGGGAGIGGGSNASATGISISTRFPITAKSESGSALVNGQGESGKSESNYIVAPEVTKGFLYEIKAGESSNDPDLTTTYKYEEEETPLSGYSQKYVQIKYRCNAGDYFLAHEDGTPIAYNDTEEFTYSSFDGLTITGSGSYKLTMAVEGASSYDPIFIKSGCTVEADSLNVGPNSGAALSVDTPENVTLKFTGSSVLQGSDSYAGLRKQGEGMLTIDGPGSLKASGGAPGGGSGIGNNNNDTESDVKNIKIIGGTIKAYGNKKAIGSCTDKAATTGVAFAPQLGMQVNAEGGTSESNTVPFTEDPTARVSLDDKTYQYIKADFSPVYYELKVVDGTDLTNSSPYVMGTEVSIEAAAASPGMEFAGWDCSAGSVVDASSPKTTFTMPAEDAVVTATYAPAPRYTLTVKDGTDLTAKSPYLSGEKVTIEANSAPKGKIFDKWMCSEAPVDNATNPKTTFTMPAKDSTVTATYRDLTFSKKTLSDTTSGVSVTADFAEDAVLVIKSAVLHEPETCEACDAIREAQEKGLVVALWDISIGGGGYKGKPTVSISVEGKHEGRDAYVLHDAERVLESVSTKIANGKATAELSSLSPVAVALAELPAPPDPPQPLPTPDPPQPNPLPTPDSGGDGKGSIAALGDTPIAPIAAIAASIAALVLAVSVVRRRREED